MNKIVFDTETNGLPVRRDGFGSYYHPSLLHYYEGSRLVQLGYIVLDKDNNEIKRYSAIVKPNNFRIENSEIHGITHDIAENTGLELVDVLEKFREDFKGCDTLVAHNIKFDYNIILSEMYRVNIDYMIREFENKRLYCTMNEGKKLYRLGKFPKLTELFSLLYKGRKWDQTHDAMDDAECCMLCYVKI
jgi:DNA polymerase-3 subunit alpha